MFKGGCSSSEQIRTSITILAAGATDSRTLPALGLLGSVALSGVIPAELPGDDDIIDIGEEPDFAPGHDEANDEPLFLCGLFESLIGVLVAMETSDDMEVEASPVVDAPTVLTGEAKLRLISCEVSPQRSDLKDGIKTKLNVKNNCQSCIYTTLISPYSKVSHIRNRFISK